MSPLLYQEWAQSRGREAMDTDERRYMERVRESTGRVDEVTIMRERSNVTYLVRITTLHTGSRKLVPVATG